ncbi:MAG: ribonuclease HI family protein [Nitrospirota bacterium]
MESVRLTPAALLRSLAASLDIDLLIEEHPHLSRSAVKKLLIEAADRLEAAPPPSPGKTKEGAEAGQLIARIDGASRGNPGPAGAGVLLEKDGKRLAAESLFLGRATNNVAEYEALLAALRLAARQPGGPHCLTIFSDSELLVRQINGEYRVRDSNLARYHREAVERMKFFPRVAVHHVPREKNVEADRLANEALDRAARNP